MTSKRYKVIGFASLLAGCQAIAGLDDFSDQSDASATGASGSTGISGASSAIGGSAGIAGQVSGTAGSGGAPAGSGGAPTGSAGSGGSTNSGGSQAAGAAGGSGSGGAGGTGGAPPDAGITCGAGTKLCGTTCALLDSPATGCAAAACTPCSTNHATARCVQGVCAILACSAGFQDCNTDPKDGCEGDLMNDPLHCGTCAKNCRSLLNAASDNQCIGGKCAIDSRIGCKGGWLSCDNNPDNGCEKQSEPNNCGDCGEVCASGFACRVHTGGALCECTTNAACNWGANGTCVPDPQDPQYMNCHCDALYCGPPGRCGVPSQGQTCKYF